MNEKLLTALAALGVIFWSSDTALALSNSWVCNDSGSGVVSYSCVSTYSYLGEDPYNVDRFSVVFPDGTKHGCTSFAAYMLYYDNAYSSAIAHFDSAQFWDTEAVAYAKATLSSTPHIGDIAQWDAAQVSPSGHVAVVESIGYTSTAAVEYIVIADDNAGLGHTTRRKLYKGVAVGVISWPHTFITFPGFVGTLGPQSSAGGGGRGPYVMSNPATTPVN